MAMNGLGWARLRVCHKCRNWYARSGDVERWPHCDAARPARELSREAMEGPASNCPRGKWDGLEPVDLEAERAQSRARMVERTSRSWKRVLDELVPAMSSQEVRPHLDNLVTERVFPQEVADVLEAYVAQRG